MTATCHQLGYEAYCQAVEDEIARTAAVIAGAAPSTRVTTCPDWSIADLAEHVGGVHRWCEQMVAATAAERARRAPDAPAPDARGEWIGSFGEQLIATFRSSDPDATMWSWGSDKHVRFWPRRMLHETTVHRADAELSLGIDPVIGSAVAIDGVDEFLDNLPHAAYFAPNVELLRGEHETIALEADGARWVIALQPDRFTWAHGADETDATVAGSPGDLLLFVYGRRKPEDMKVEGDSALLERWIVNSCI